MNSITVRLLTLLACVCLASSSGSPWWSLAVSSGAVSKSDSESCEELKEAGILSDKLLPLCEDDSATIKAIATGTRKAVISCQQQFSNSTWNCTTFKGVKLYGESIHRDSNLETAVLQSYNSIGAVKGLAEFCQEGRLELCPCVKTVVSERDDQNNFILSACDDNVDWAWDYFEKFQNLSNCNKSALDVKISEHNSKIGIRRIKNTKRVCTCHGISGSCSLQTCYIKTLDVAEATDDLHDKYSEALKVVLVNNELVSAHDNSTAVLEDQLAFADASPNYCTADLDQGSIGTAHRICGDHCRTICCDRGFYPRTIREPIKECRFVSEPRYDIVCETVGEVVIREKRCKPPCTSTQC